MRCLSESELVIIPAMTSPSTLLFLMVSPLFASTVVPDTGLVLKAVGLENGGRRALEIRIVNQSRSSKDALAARIFLTGDSSEIADFSLVPDSFLKLSSSGATVSIESTVVSSIGKAHARPLIPGCKTACQMELDLPLPGLSLGAIETFRLVLGEDRFSLPGNDHLGQIPSHDMKNSDWSLGGIPFGTFPTPVRFSDLRWAPHIQLLSKGNVVWGTAPGEAERVFPRPWKRDGLATTIDAIRIPYPDSLDRRVRDSANLNLARVLVNQAGYRMIDVAAGNAVFQTIGASSTTFSVLDANGSVVGQGSLTPKGFTDSASLQIVGSNSALDVAGGDTAYTMQTATRTGPVWKGIIPIGLRSVEHYRIVVGADTSHPFVVDDRVYSWLRDAELRFFGAQRSGNSDSWMHGPSHTGDPAPGGWYDCGDYIKEGITQSYAMAVLGLMAASHPERDADRTAYNHDSMRVTDGIPDVLRELKHGADYLLGSWTRSGSSASSLVSSIGAVGTGHRYWGPPEWNDLLAESGQGGLFDRTARIDTGTPIRANFAAGLAFYSVLWKRYDALEAARALEVAKALYAAARANPDYIGNVSSYSGPTTAVANLSLAAVALLWATGDTLYLKDLAYDPTFASRTKRDSTNLKRFDGGWLDHRNAMFSKGPTNFSWGDIHPMARYAFHRLILRDSSSAARRGVASERERLLLEERVGLGMASDLSMLSGGTMRQGHIALPGRPGYQAGFDFDTTWESLHAMEWGWGRYEAGNAGELALYAEIADDLQGVNLPHFSDTTHWNAGPVRQLALRSLDLLLGENPWDLSLVLGVGSKNPIHVHHHGGNPEGRNIPLDYAYSTPIGGLYGGYAPDMETRTFVDAISNGSRNEACLDGTATLLIPAILFSTDDGKPTSGIRGASAIHPARFGVTSTSRGFRIRWVGATGEVDVLVVDVAGHHVGEFHSGNPTGQTEIVIPKSRNNLFLNIHDGKTGRTFTIPRL